MKRILLLFCLVNFLLNTHAQNNCSFLCNSDFEDELLGPGLVMSNDIACWNTTATDGMIEMWTFGFGGVQAYSGNRFIELNAYQVSTLYQSFMPIPNTSVQVSFAHRGRAGVDVMRVEIGPAGGPYTTLGTYSDGTSWGYYTVNYTFPSSATSTYRLRFVSVSAAGGNPAIGNFLDAITINHPQPQVNFDILQPSCGLPNGSITAQISGGLAPYTINWQPPVTSSSTQLLNLSAGTYVLHVTDSYGCQAQRQAVLVSQPQINTTISQSICQGSTYNFNNNTYSQSGTYQHTLTSINGCDSTVTLNLTVNPNTPITNQIISSCGSYVWPVNNQTYNQRGVYSIIQQNIFGCDSTINLNLTVFSAFTNVTNISSCTNYTWSANNQTYTQSGSYPIALSSVNGCDSVSYLNLIITPSYSYDIVAHICEHQTYSLAGNVYTEEGSYEINLSSVHGCDSLISLTLNTDPAFIDVNANVCDGQLYLFEGVKYLPGNHLVPYVNSNGCNVLANLTITNFADYNNFRADTICQGKSIDISNNEFDETGIYQVHLTTDAGCDSNITLSLYVRPTGNNAFLFPNIFTPNLDNINDLFTLVGDLSEISFFEFFLYNRWGNLIHTSNDPNVNWNGKFMDKDVSNGVYYFVCFFKTNCTGNQINENKGSITVLR